MYFCPDIEPVMCHSRILLRWIQQAEAVLWDQKPLFPVAAGARKKLSQLLFERLNAVASPALHALLQSRLSRENPVAALNMELVPRSQREAAAAALFGELDGGNLSALENIPVLRHRLDLSTAQFTDMIQEMLMRIAAHRRAVAETFFGDADLGEIIDVSCDGSDLHENGRCTVVVTTSGGKFLYKPHDCSADSLYGQLVHRFFSDITYAPRCVAGHGYGFCEFVHANPAEQEEDIRRYFRHFGSLCALFQGLGSSDLHVENFLAVGDRPVLIDLETLLTPSPKVFGEGPQMDAQNSFANALNHSLYPSSLLPLFTGGRDLSPLLNQEQTDRGFPVLGGVVQTVRSYEDDFLFGFETGYRRCMELRRELEDFLHHFSSIRIRRLLRHTNYYATLHRRLLAPDALASVQAQKAVTVKLRSYFGQANAPHLVPIAEAEEAALLRGDIPYFYTMGSSCDLFSAGQVVIKDYFANSGVENARIRLAQMGEEELSFEKKLLAAAIHMAVVPLPKGEHRSVSRKKENDILTQDRFYAEAERCMKKICAYALRTPGGTIGWLTNMEGKTTAMGADLIHGTAGLGVFLSTCASSGMTDAKPYADACLENIEYYIHGLEQGNPLQLAKLQPGLGGAAGILRALRLMQVNMPEAKMLYKRLLKILPQMKIEAAGVDVISGISGLLTELSVSEMASEGELIQRCVQRLLQTKSFAQPDGTLLWDTLGKKRAISGMGHGMAGIGTALIQAYEVLGEWACLSAAQDAFAWESRIYSEQLGTWPDLRVPGTPSAMHGYCSGAPGIGLALLSCINCRDRIPDWEKSMDRAIRACRQQGIRFRDHLCCGNSAAVDFMLEAGSRLGQEELTNSSHRLLSNMVLRMQDDYFYLPSSYQSAFTPTLFYGAAGVGYTLLRAANSSLSSVLI